MPTIDLIAKTINGPNDRTHVGTKKLAELQDLTWARLKSQEQLGLLRSARYIQQLYEEKPDGWVITSGDDTTARYHEYNELTGSFISWTTDLDKALWFARRDDAERFAADDDDAWHIRRVSDIRAAGPVALPIAGVRDRAGGGHDAPGGNRGGIAVTGTDTPPPAATLPVDTRSVEDLLRMFRAFVSRNATQWVMGAGDHHHPMWADLSNAIDKEDASFGPEWAYLQPLNRKEYVVLVEEWIDLQAANAAEERGG